MTIENKEDKVMSNKYLNVYVSHLKWTIVVAENGYRVVVMLLVLYFVILSCRLLSYHSYIN